MANHGYDDDFDIVDADGSWNQHDSYAMRGVDCLGPWFFYSPLRHWALHRRADALYACHQATSDVAWTKLELMAEYLYPPLLVLKPCI